MRFLSPWYVFHGDLGAEDAEYLWWTTEPGA